MIAVPALVLAGPIKPFDAKNFDALTASGQPVVVVVHASWCRDLPRWRWRSA